MTARARRPDRSADADALELERSIGRIAELAAEFGLDTFPMRFEVCPAEVIYTFGAYGMPTRFSHWSFGKAFHRMKTQYDFGLSKIYELVINSDPCYAFLLDTNGLVQNQMVAAHVYGHCDFFKHNRYFAHTNRKMVESMAAAAERIRGYEFDHGQAVVERFLDACLALQAHSGATPAPAAARRSGNGAAVAHDRSEPVASRDPYADLWALDRRVPPERMSAGNRGEREAGAEAAGGRASRGHGPRRSDPAKAPTAREAAAWLALRDRGEPGPRPGLSEPDLLGFIARRARGLSDWQLDVIGIVRDEARYFRPQMETKLMNEGWASYWHARIMRRLDLSPAAAVEFARMHASILQPGRTHLNPYHVGYEMWCDIERRLGREALFELRECERDVSFVRNHLTEDLVGRLDLYLYAKAPDGWRVSETGWKAVRDGIVASLTNCGLPYLYAEDDDHRGRGELYLRHAHEGRDLDFEHAEKTLEHVYYLWGRAVHLETVQRGQRVVLSYDGVEHRTA